MPAVLGYVIITRLSDNVWPAVNELYARGDTEVIRKTYLRLQRSMALLAFPLCFGVLLFHRPLIELWTGPQQYAGRLMTVALALFCLAVSLQHVNWVFRMAAGKIGGYSSLTMAEAGLNLTLSVALGRLLGLGGVALAAVVANIPTNLYLQRAVHRELAVPIRWSLAKCYLPALVPASLAAALGWIALAFLPGGKLSVFAVSASIFLLSHGLLSYVFVLEPGEREQIRSTLANLWQAWSRTRLQQA
jgi:O-antigen/teichoic acid export membrane protein